MSDDYRDSPVWPGCIHCGEPVLMHQFGERKGQPGKVCASCFLAALGKAVRAVHKPWGRPWPKPPQHLRLPPRAVSSLCSLLRRIRRGMTTERDAWRVLSLVSRLDRAEGELRAMRRWAEGWRSDCRRVMEERDALREELREIRRAPYRKHGYVERGDNGR